MMSPSFNPTPIPFFTQKDKPILTKIGLEILDYLRKGKFPQYSDEDIENTIFKYKDEFRLGRKLKKNITFITVSTPLVSKILFYYYATRKNNSTEKVLKVYDLKNTNGITSNEQTKIFRQIKSIVTKNPKKSQQNRININLHDSFLNAFNIKFLNNSSKVQDINDDLQDLIPEIINQLDILFVTLSNEDLITLTYNFSLYFLNHPLLSDRFTESEQLMLKQYLKEFEIITYYQYNILHNHILISRPPLSIQIEEDLFNNINGPTVIYDKYQLYYINGVQVSKAFFEALNNKKITFEKWMEEPNEEIKAIIIYFYTQKFGDEFVYRFLSAHLKEINTYIDKKDPKYLKGTIESMNIGVYTLFKGNFEIGDEDKVIAFVRCYCPSTDRMFFLGVDGNKVKNAKDAIASLCQIPKKLKKHLISISRQGEIFSFNFDEIGTNLLKKNLLSPKDFKNCIPLKGHEYFSKLKFEY